MDCFYSIGRLCFGGGELVMKSFRFTTPIVLSVLMSIYFVSCGVNDSNLSESQQVVTHSFPVAVGMLWTYEVYDSLTGKTDTVLVSVTDTFTFENGQQTYQWRFKSSDDILIKKSILSGDTFAFFGRAGVDFPEEYFIFPLELGNEWTGPRWGDTSIVSDSGLVSVPAGDFAVAFLIDRRWNLDFEGGGNRSETWIVPEVGVAYRYLFNSWSDGAHITVSKNEVWELLSYDLSTFDIDQFPLEVGSEWTYETFDSALNKYDTMNMTITDTVTIWGGTEATIWVQTYSDFVDTQYVVVIDNRIYVYEDTLLYWGSPEQVYMPNYYEFPLAIGRYWGIDFFAPIPDVIDKGRIKVPAGTYENGFLHAFSWSGFNYHVYIEAWLVPEVGIVSQRLVVYDFGPMFVTTWKLLSFNLAD
jgi:hypothetical protein